jgi:hypothetical protein
MPVQSTSRSRKYMAKFTPSVALRHLTSEPRAAASGFAFLF